MKTFYRVVVKSGDTCRCGALQYINDHCGHNHNTLKSANNCLLKLQSVPNSSWDADWRDAEIVELDKKTKTEMVEVTMCDEDDEYSYHSLVSAKDACKCSSSKRP